MSRAPLCVVGDAMLDRDLEGRADRLSPDAPVPVVDAPSAVLRPGGAALAAAMAAADGREVTLVTAIGDDAAGDDLRRLLERCGVDVVDLGLDGRTTEKIRVRAGGQVLLRMDHGERDSAVGTRGGAAKARAAIEWAGAVLVACYGRGVTAHGPVRAALADKAATAPVVWDPHPHGAPPVPGVAVATPNAKEATGFSAGVERAQGLAPWELAPVLAAHWGAERVAVTLGSRGAALAAADEPAVLVGATPAEGDPCGAGDRFAAAVAGALADGRDARGAVREGVRRASAFVAAGGAAAFRPGVATPEAPAGAAELAAKVRAEGGTVAATGGCFDLLHAGHLAVLQQAAALGDLLVVCLNSDASVRRLKGPSRPVVSQEDRAAVLAALACVDAVAVFDEDTPERVLRELRPHVWVKGGDYDVTALPENAALAEWGGRSTAVPLLDGRSTTTIIEEVVRRAAG